MIDRQASAQHALSRALSFVHWERECGKLPRELAMGPTKIEDKDQLMLILPLLFLSSF